MIQAAPIIEMGVNRNLAGNAFFNSKAQGMPWVVVLLAILFVWWNFVLSRTNSAGFEWIVTGAVLALAAGFDAGVRRARAG